MMIEHKDRRLRLFLLSLVFIPIVSFSQITILTFEDVNNDGVQDTDEELISGLSITATDANGNEFPFLDDGAGTFLLPAELVTSRIRVQVKGYNDQLGPGVAGPTSVFFVEDRNATILIPVSTGATFAMSESRIMIPCYDAGPIEGRSDPAFVSFPYMVDGVASSKGGEEVDPQKDAEVQEIGSTWGVAYQPTKERAFTSTLMKRHTGLGPEGLGGLYMIDYSGSEAEVHAMNLQGIVPSEGPTLDFGSVLRESVDGDVTPAMPYALTSQPNTATYDMDAFDKIGAVGFGDIDMEENDNTLWMVNLHQRSLVRMDVSDGELVPNTQNIKNYPIIEMKGLPNLNYRFAMCINAGGNTNNSGAEPFTDRNRIAWDKNKFSNGGDFSFNSFVIGNLLNSDQHTSEQMLYHTYRRGNFSYNIPVPTNEQYQVRLHFAEPNDYEVGDRKFDIMAEDQMIASSFDIVAHANGTKRATTLTFNVTPDDNMLDLTFIAKAGNRIQEALLSGIEVLGQSVQESGVLRPWGLTLHEGKGYLGVVADGSISKSREHLFGFVLEFDPNNLAEGFHEMLAFPLAYPRERASNAHLSKPQPLRSAEWQAWVNDWESTHIYPEKETLSPIGGVLCSYPQPMISDINFTADGGMVLALMDRWAHQTGFLNHPPDLSDNSLISSYAAGDILRSFSTDVGMDLESQNFDQGAFFRKDDGPSYAGEFFFDDHFVANAAHHGEISTGGTGILPGSGEVVNTVFNPVKVENNQNYDYSGVYTQGIQFYNTDQGNKERAYLFVDQYVAGKANGLGDIEFVSELVGGEVGNYVWCDANGNGIQDPYEYGIDGITLTLHDKEDSENLVQTVVSDNGGQFVFTGLDPNHCYAIRLDLSQLVTMGFSGLVSQIGAGDDPDLDSDGDPTMIPGFSVAMFCTGDVGENDHSIDFGFIGPEANECTLVACDDGSGCASFELERITNCVLPVGSTNDVAFFADVDDNDSLINEITAGPYAICADDSIYVRVSIPGDAECFSVAKVYLNILSNNNFMPLYEETICDNDVVSLFQILDDNGLEYTGVDFYLDESKTTRTGQDSTMYTVPAPPHSVYFIAAIPGGCTVMGQIDFLPYSTVEVFAGNDTTVCGDACVDLTSAEFTFVGTGSTTASWSTMAGDGSFIDGTAFGVARLYCPGPMDIESGQVILRLESTDAPCGDMFDEMTVIFQAPIPEYITHPADTISCLHPFVQDPATHDTFPLCSLIVDCDRIIEGTVVDYHVLQGDCIDIIKAIKRTILFEYQKEEFMCMDTIYVRALPDTIVCPPERDTVYCHDGYLKDENGHPDPSVTGAPLADSIPLWPVPPSICDYHVIYKDTEFTGDCPMTIKREWFIKNSCTGDFDTCTQWIMIEDTLGPDFIALDTLMTYPSATGHECAAEVYVPKIMVEDTCSGIKQVKARIENHGSVVLEYNSETGYYESHETVKLPVSDLFNGEPYKVIYEAVDGCHNKSMDSTYMLIVDRVRPVAVCDKGINLTVSDSLEWVPAEVFAEGVSDNCGVSLMLARRSDWATACGVDLCDDTTFLYAGKHHDSLYIANLETDKHKNPVEAHYANYIKWLCEDGSQCATQVLSGWAYDLAKYATLHCKEHPYEVDDTYFNELFGGEGLYLPSMLACQPDLQTFDVDLYIRAIFDLFPWLYANVDINNSHGNEVLKDLSKQIGGGWSDAVPFCCEDACQEVTVEVLVMDYWCNWSTCWTKVQVEDKTPPKILCDLENVTISCSSYKKYYADAVDLALQGEYDSIQSVLGTYDHVVEGPYGAPDKTEFTVYDLRCDSVLVEKDSLVYDEHLGYQWVPYKRYVSEYKLEEEPQDNGQVADNCGLTIIEEKPWVNIDECGNGYIKRTFKFVGQCFSEPSGHVTDTLTRHQTIWITNDCDIASSMFEVPRDTVINSCGIEYETDGSGNVGGLLSPDNIGHGKYLFDNDCRLVGIGYYDKVFKIVGGDEACYKVIRTWCFADWCALGKPAEKAWWSNPRYEGKYLSYTQKIIVIDTEAPQCVIENLPEEITAAGCYYDLNTTVLAQDDCGVLQYNWQVIDTKTDEVIASESGSLNSGTLDIIRVSVEDMTQGQYRLKVILTDECQNESICDAPFTINANKKPTPVCITSLTTELTPMDTDGDGIIDTAMAEIWASEFDVSSQPACNSPASGLSFRIDRAVGDPALPPASATNLIVGCDDQGTHEVRLYVVDQSGTWDYCTVLLSVQDNSEACPPASSSDGLLSGEIITEEGADVEKVRVTVEGNAGVPLWEIDQVSGVYALNVTKGVEAFVRPLKDTDPINGVSTGDLIAIQKYILGKKEMGSWYKEEAADANDDGKVSAIDLIQIRKLILGMTDRFPNSDSWRFYNMEDNKSSYYIGEMLEEMSVDFIGVKIGDVDGSNDPSRRAGRSAEAFTMNVDKHLESQKVNFRVNSNEVIEGIQFTLEYDPQMIKVSGILDSGVLGLGDDNVYLGKADQGLITLSWFNKTGEPVKLQEGQTLFSLALIGGEDVDLSEIMTISSRVTQAEAYHGSGLESDVNLVFSSTVTEHTFELMQNRPNPWKGETIIGYTVPEEGESVLTVYDVSGKVVKVLRADSHRGYNEWTIGNRDLPSKGVYYYKITSSDQTAIKRMILMD